LAVSKILCIGNCGAGYAGKHLSQALDYISKKEKTGDGRWEGCLNCLPGNIYQQMRQTKEHFGKTDKHQGYHIILSFAEGEVDADTAFEISKNGGFAWADMVRRDLDVAVGKASSYEAFFSVLAGMGYGIKNAYPHEWKYLAVKPMGMAGYRRCKSLGEEYTRENIQKRIRQGCSRAAGDSPESYLQYEKRTRHQTDGYGIQYKKKEAHSVIQEYYFTKICRVKALKNAHTARHGNTGKI